MAKSKMKMNLSPVEDDSSANQMVHKPEEIDWEMLDKSRFFVLGAGLFSCVSATLYPVVVLKTRQQVSSSNLSSLQTAISILKYEGFRGLYRGFGTSLVGTIPARAVYMAALEVTKSNVGMATVRLGFPEGSAAVAASAVAGLTAAVAAQVVWTPIDVVSQRLMVQGNNNNSNNNSNSNSNSNGNSNSNSKNKSKYSASDGLKSSKYMSGIDAFKKIVKNDGAIGLYRGFGISVMTYAPSNAVWWASYSVVQRLVWGGIGSYLCDNKDGPDSRTVMAVQGASAAMAGGVSALVTMPLDTIKTRLQVLDNSDDNNNGRKGPTIGQTVRNLVREGGWVALYRGLGPRWASMSMSATTMITTYELLKRLSTKSQEGLMD